MADEELKDGEEGQDHEGDTETSEAAGEGDTKPTDAPESEEEAA